MTARYARSALRESREFVARMSAATCGIMSRLQAAAWINVLRAGQSLRRAKARISLRSSGLRNLGSVMAGLVPAIHVFSAACVKTWMPATSAGMTTHTHYRPLSRSGSPRFVVKFGFL